MQDYIELDSVSYKKLVALKNKAEGKSIFLIGGGPSLKDFDFSRLKGKFTIGVNKCYEKIIPDLLYFSDSCFYDWYKPEIDALKCEKASIANTLKQPFNIIKLGCTGETGLEMRFGNVRHGSNSGHAALNVTYHLRPKQVFLLGFDMKQEDNNTHWHSGYQDKKRSSGPLFSANKWIENFKTVSVHYRNVNFKIWNCNPESNLYCFPGARLEEALKEI